MTDTSTVFDPSAVILTLEAQVKALTAERDALLKRVDHLKKWADLGAAVINQWRWCLDVEASEIFDMAHDTGVISPVEGGYDPERHEDEYGISPEIGDNWYDVIEEPS